MSACDDLPGEPLPSGFDFRPSQLVPGVQLSEDAMARVLATMIESDRARALAAADAKNAWIG